MKILGMGMPELLIILGVILLIFGPKNLPKLGSALGSTVKNLGQSLLTAGISGLVSGISAYSLAGGFGGGGDVAQAGKGFVSGSQSVLRNLQAGNILRNGLKASRR